MPTMPTPARWTKIPSEIVAVLIVLSLAGCAAPAATQLLGQVGGDPRTHLLAEGGFLGRVAELHRSSLTRFAQRHAGRRRVRDAAALLVGVDTPSA